ncbi:acetaldehyde dehydrogenase [Sesbania bispinosa]|nr:acetaldehyde dehydrogenase [Sesbania bispinosa]
MAAAAAIRYGRLASVWRGSAILHMAAVMAVTAWRLWRPFLAFFFFFHFSGFGPGSTQLTGFFPFSSPPLLVCPTAAARDTPANLVSSLQRPSRASSDEFCWCQEVAQFVLGVAARTDDVDSAFPCGGPSVQRLRFTLVLFVSNEQYGDGDATKERGRKRRDEVRGTLL